MAVNTKWHYTTGDRFVLIVEDGEIKPAKAGVPANERSIVWFSTNQEWEPTACKAMLKKDGTMVRLDMLQTAQSCQGLVRFGVAPETAPHDWRELKELSGMSGRMAKGLYREAINQGSRPGDWWGTFEPVPRCQWLHVQVWHDALWVDVPFDSDSPEGHSESTPEA